MDHSEYNYLQTRFVAGLLDWNLDGNTRKMPWKGEKDPYRIWLSEVILQQTRVEQGLKYYEAFISHFPDVHALASAPEQKVYKLWEGLGYYSRCRNLIYTAKYISTELEGVFPQDYESILSLKGVGAYTASAIASFAWNLPHAVLDGNVYRVLSRVYNVSEPIDSSGGKKLFRKLADESLPQKEAALYNQAIMDFGAVICKPVPQCSICFFNAHCPAYATGRQQLLPVKEKKTSIRERWLNYIILRHRNLFPIRQRAAGDVWHNLYEFPLIETAEPVSFPNLSLALKEQLGISGTDFKKVKHLEPFTQRLSHQLINFRISLLEADKKPVLEGFIWVPAKELRTYAFPRSLQEFIATELQD
jgi:A/G-specific adenine glycosylase